MNGLCGIFRLDGEGIDQQQLWNCAFHSPKWQPDHQDLFIQDNIGLVCTQRFITPECAAGLMPLQHRESGDVIVADAYLTNRPELIAALAVEHDIADCALILAAYHKWGNESPKYLAGLFMFAVWNPRQQRLFVATDHFGQRPCLYAWLPGKYFIFANYMTPFRQLCNRLTINESLFAHFALDAMPDEGTCYQEVQRILPAHSLDVSAYKLQQQCYWQLKQQKRRLPYRQREQYYEAFHALFSETVSRYTRSSWPISAHISGGLDSSSVASVAASWLAEKNQLLYGFTAVPQGLDGPSYRDGWYYHEMPRVQAILAQYPNIQHTRYSSLAENDPFQNLYDFYPLVDQPIRNVFNFDWILASYAMSLQQGSRIQLQGQKGNGTISWSGQSYKHFLRNVYLGMKVWCKPGNIFGGYYAKHHPSFMKSRQGRHILRQRAIILDAHYWMLTQTASSSRQSGFRPITLWYGIENLDPTADIRLTEFCYNLPQWIYYKGRGKLARRLLVREGLAGVVPEEIRLNPYRGEQAADAYLQYNQHRQHWLDKIQTILGRQSGELLDRWYDRKKMLQLFAEYQQIRAVDQAIVLQVYCNLARYLSMGFYLDYLQQA